MEDDQEFYWLDMSTSEIAHRLHNRSMPIEEAFTLARRRDDPRHQILIEKILRS